MDFNIEQINASLEYGETADFDLICEDRDEDPPNDPGFIRMMTLGKDEQINAPLESGNTNSELVYADLQNELESVRMTTEKNEEINAPMESGETNSNLVFRDNKTNSDLHLKANENKTSSSISQRCPLQSILNKHLFLPQPLGSTGKNKRMKDNFPSEISSVAWRMKLARKEEQKTQKEQEAKKKREEKQAQAKDRQKKC
ncbi:hypothetical protein NQ314_013394 [Rhamnusium bicolor]|uniref:Uncharacterized protein n=1 Tax=Rhamnusium bicolor TaxID=1586634 RepID=A0AAV8X742_9CUCU|nr:hypothetical protein NQ314_013394 [Rhamnusium bicolor]